MLRPSLPTTIAIEQHIDLKTGPVYIDPTQLHQILMNLCTNAYPAKKETGGTLTIKVTSEQIETGTICSQPPQVQPGRYVHLEVRDTGCGIPPEIQKQTFDLFFTTKETQKATGMGLAILHGTINGSDDYITLDSTPGNGTTFHVFLPIVAPKSLAQSVPAESITDKNEHILLVDDKEILTAIIKTCLKGWNTK